MLHPLELELAFETLSLPDLNHSEDDPISQAQLNCLLLIENGQLSSGLDSLERLYLKSELTLVKLFCLQWGIAITETIYDLNLRHQWMQKWKQVANWEQQPFGRYLHRFHIAVQFYYDQSLHDAEKLFLLNLHECEKQNYPRGQVRSLFHLGLIYQSWGQLDRAQSTFQQALSLCHQYHLGRSAVKIQDQLAIINKGYLSTNSLYANIEKNLHDQKLRSARRQILCLCRQRRLEKRSWFSSSEYAYLALVNYAFGKLNRFIQILEKSNDMLVIEQTLRLADKLSPLPELLSSRLTYLESISGYKQISRSRDQSQVTIANQTVTSIDDKEVVLLLNALIEKENGLDKEQLVTILWNTDYDPLYHDPKIYRVIHRARKKMGINDLIVNKYGFYVLGTHLK